MITPTSARPVVNRRGSTVWHVVAEGGTYAVKIGYPSHTHAHTALAPSREAHILRALGVGPIHDGEWAEGTWSVQPWHSGPSLYDKWAPHRAPGNKAVPSRLDALASATALANLHRSGWVHGDVQPAHLIMGSAGATLIDLGLARGGHVPARWDFPYKGCLVHYEAPEIARSVLAHGTAEPTRESDVYALGASLLISATGWRHVAYADDASREEQRQAIVDKPHRPVVIAGELGRLTDAMLSYHPSDRPTADEICTALMLAT
ncbi:protein kinase [Streptomyces sp. NPDC048018]|uniref:protein kinase domain-containing protein n=1 Tax=Streptomyces sp. NPDC048018 TaxID=3365499 RepID=UPI003711E593